MRLKEIYSNLYFVCVCESVRISSYTTLALLMFDSCLSLRQDPRGFQEARKNRGNRGVGGMVATAPTAPVTTSRRSQAGLLSLVSDISGQISGYFGRVMMSCAHSWPLRSALHRERSGEDASAGRNCWNAQLCRGVPCVLAKCLWNSVSRLPCVHCFAAKNCRSRPCACQSSGSTFHHADRHLNYECNAPTREFD